MGQSKALTISVEELGRRLNISRSKAYELTKVEGFPKLRVGARVLIPLVQLEQWIANQTEVLQEEKDGTTKQG